MVQIKWMVRKVSYKYRGGLEALAGEEVPPLPAKAVSPRRLLPAKASSPRRHEDTRIRPI